MLYRISACALLFLALNFQGLAGRPSLSSFPALTTQTIDIAPVKNRNPEDGHHAYEVPVRLAARADGSFRMGVQNDWDVYVYQVDASLRIQGRPVVLRNYQLFNMVELDDGSLVLALGRSIDNRWLGTKTSNVLYLLKLDPNGKTVFTTRLHGGEGQGLLKSWFDGRVRYVPIATNGKEFGVYFEVQQKLREHPTLGVHNGDMFMVVDRAGVPIKERTHFWTASHSSLLQATVGSDGDFYTLTVGDANPIGLQLFNRDENESLVIWPPQNLRVTYARAETAHDTGMPRYFAAAGDDLIAFVAAGDPPGKVVTGPLDVLFLRFSRSGKIKEERWLTKTAGVRERRIGVSPFGDGHLIVWGADKPGKSKYDDYAPHRITVARLDSKFRIEGRPVEQDASFGDYSRPITLAGGDVIWAYAQPRSSKIKIARVAAP